MGGFTCLPCKLCMYNCPEVSKYTDVFVLMVFGFALKRLGSMKIDRGRCINNKKVVKYFGKKLAFKLYIFRLSQVVIYNYYAFYKKSKSSQKIHKTNSASLSFIWKWGDFNS